MKKKLIMALLIIAGLLLSWTLINKTNLNKEKGINKDSFKNVNKLMIVAHPDDETIWGGDHLNKDKYLVVCITCGNSIVRTKEFKSVLKQSDDKYIFLGYPDKTKGKRDNWTKDRKSIEKDIKYIINYKNWDKIITHNPKGEYGHIQHKNTSKIVTKYSDKKTLYYFGNYYKKKNISKNKENKLDKKSLEKKKELIKNYTSQQFVVNKLEHMLEYENFIQYSEWEVKNERK